MHIVHACTYTNVQNVLNRYKKKKEEKDYFSDRKIGVCGSSAVTRYINS